MPFYNAAVKKLVEELAKLPGIGPRTAERLALYILKTPPQQANSLARAITEVKEKISYCKVCNNLSQTSLCQICQDQTRDKSIVCVVEQPNDVAAIEKTGVFHGRYHVLLGSLSPLDGIGPDNLTVGQLIARVKSGEVKEVIIATNCNAEGETTALYLTRLIKPLGVKVTRIAHGIAVGSTLEYTDQATLSKAMEGRQGV
jgi:recombination protein RecR